jgi:hypothetical protein
MRLVDVYKLAHQACLGSEHAVSDWTQAERWLEEELAQLGEGPTEPMLDPISTDGRLVRVHLRPFLASDGDVAELLEAFVRTANGYRGSTAQLRAYWADVEVIAGTGRLPFQRAEAEVHWRQMEALNCPAVRHSGAYAAAYLPAYRVVAAEFLPDALQAVVG